MSVNNKNILIFVAGLALGGSGSVVYYTQFAYTKVECFKNTVNANGSAVCDNSLHWVSCPASYTPGRCPNT